MIAPLRPGVTPAQASAPVIETERLRLRQWQGSEIVLDRVPGQDAGHGHPVVSPATVDVVSEAAHHAVEQKSVAREHDVRSAVEHPSVDRRGDRMTSSTRACLDQHEVEICEKGQRQAAGSRPKNAQGRAHVVVQAAVTRAKCTTVTAG